MSDEIKWRDVENDMPKIGQWVVYKNKRGVWVEKFDGFDDADDCAEWLPVQVEEEKPRSMITIGKLEPDGIYGAQYKIVASWGVDADDFAEFLSEQVEKYGK